MSKDCTTCIDASAKETEGKCPTCIANEAAGQPPYNQWREKPAEKVA